MRLQVAFVMQLAALFVLAEAAGAEVTFNREIAPIVFQHCYECHREGEAAPFELKTYEDVKKRGRQIAEVVRSRLMPPWMPAPGGPELEHERRLSEAEIGLIEAWVRQGSPEGDPADLPEAPVYASGWKLGQPDLVVQLPEAYQLEAAGEDTYRNFVIPLSITRTQHVAGYEFRPGNSKAVHHAFISVDRSGDSRRRDAEDEELGFPGLHTSSKLEPSYGFFTSWQPGKVPARYRVGMSWPLPPGSDLVLQLHLQHTGKRESARPEVGFYFADAPSAKQPMKICVRSMDIKIPAGSTSTVVTASFPLAGDVEVLGVLPHAHYLARRIEGSALLPDGREQPLLLIENWNFDWQGDYSYKKPVFLPKGTVIQMRCTFDNSEGNPRNPNQPPKEVGYGLQSTDEMAEFWLQLLPRTEEGAKAIGQDWASRVMQESLKYSRFLAQKNPRDPAALADIGAALTHLGRARDALRYFEKSLQIKPAAETHYHHAIALEQLKQYYPARLQYEAALKLEPDYFKARNNLGLLFLQHGEFATAEELFQEVLRIRPQDEMATQNLELTRKLAREHRK